MKLGNKVVVQKVERCFLKHPLAPPSSFYHERRLGNWQGNLAHPSRRNGLKSVTL